MKDLFEIKNNFLRYKDIKSELVYGNPHKSNIEYTIAIPTFKRPHLLKEAINSALSQTGNHEYEIIVIDNEADFSQETAVETLIKSYNNPKINYYKNKENIGMFGNWNRCFELAKGDWVTILNDDDWLEPNYLSEVTKLLKQKEVDLIFVRYTTHDFRKISMSQEKENVKSLCKKLIKKIITKKFCRKLNWMDFVIRVHCAGSLGVLFSKQLTVKYGGFNEDYYPASDYYFIANLAINNNAYMINRKLANRRIQENESLVVANKYPECNLLFRQYLLNNINSDFKKLPLKLLSNSLYKIEKENTYKFYRINEKYIPAGFLEKKCIALYLYMRLFLIEVAFYRDISCGKKRQN